MLVDFYHLASSPVEHVLPRICEKMLAGGKRLLVIAQADLVQRLDLQLWSYKRDAFLPHGRAGETGEQDQPILLSLTAEPVNGATSIAIADGQWRDEALDFERVFYLFGTDHLDQARACWRELAQRDSIERRYWKQDEQGKWVEGP